MDQLRMLQEQQNAMAATINALQSENETLKGAMVQGLASLPTVCQGLQGVLSEMQRAQSSGSRTTQLFDTKGLGRPKTFEEKEEKFPIWTRKVENFLIGSFGESFRQVLQWAYEHDEPVDKDLWDIQFGMGAEDAVEDIDHKVQQLYTVLVDLTEDDSNDIVVGSGEGNGLEAWRKLARRWDPASGGRKRALLKAILNPPRCKISELSGCMERWLQQIAKYQRRRNAQGVREQISDDIKSAALDQLVPEDLENHLVLNAHRLKTFEARYGEVVAIVEARTGVKIKEPSIKQHSQPGWKDDPMDVDPFGKAGKGNGKGKDGGKNRQDLVCHRCGKKGHVQKDCWSKETKAGGGKATKAHGGDRGGKSDIVCHQCGKKGHIKKDCWHNKGGPGGKGGGKAGRGGKHGKGKHASSLDEEQAEGNDEGCLDLSAFECRECGVDVSMMHADDVDVLELTPFQKRDDNWVRLNLDSGAAITAFPRRFAPAGHSGGNGQTYKAATGELTQDEGGIKMKAEDEYGQMRGIAGRIADIHKPLLAAGECTDKEQDIWLTHNGGWVLARNSEVGKKIQRLLEAEARKERHQMMPVYKERGVFNVYVKLNQKSSIAAIDDAEEKAAKATATTTAVDPEIKDMLKTLVQKMEAVGVSSAGGTARTSHNGSSSAGGTASTPTGSSSAGGTASTSRQPQQSGGQRRR